MLSRFLAPIRRNMRGMTLNGVNRNFAKKMGIADALTVLEDKISNISQLNDIQEYGKVISIGDGIARVFGLNNVQAGEMVQFESGV